MESILYAGLDVHKNSIEVALAEGGREGEVRRYGRIGEIWIHWTRLYVSLFQQARSCDSCMRQALAVTRYIVI